MRFADLSRDAPVSADLFIKRLRSSVVRLRQFPESGSVVPELGIPTVREVFYGSYRVIYRIGQDRVEVLTVFHGARLFDQGQI